ncbi:hypothetical protein [Superficieibacter sp. HKU1]|uniref:hypothetical protein n=1 Tax=Superficieibacter sp. HKU1 TaxID=3031919 RepID=UPI0023E144B0|nr:hypothetical protein [Superficieibacter sp. HKU1]WES66588.1 hypothetical protein P0H77_12995 [Superficieibacter sp. HKU1]
MNIIKKIIDLIFIFIFAAAMLSCVVIKDELLKTNEIIAIKWCYGRDLIQQQVWEKYLGFYLYTEQLEDGRYILRAQVYNALLTSIFDNYWLNYSKPIAVVADKRSAQKEWSKIVCKTDGNIEIGNKGYILPQDFIRWN